MSVLVRQCQCQRCRSWSEVIFIQYFCELLDYCCVTDRVDNPGNLTLLFLFLNFVKGYTRLSSSRVITSVDVRSGIIGKNIFNWCGGGGDYIQPCDGDVNNLYWAMKRSFPYLRFLQNWVRSSPNRSQNWRNHIYYPHNLEKSSAMKIPGEPLARKKKPLNFIRKICSSGILTEIQKRSYSNSEKKFDIWQE